MLRIILVLLVTYLHAESVYGMDCSLGSKTGIIAKYLYNCPLPTQSDRLSYCCYKSDGDFYCCDAEEFALKTGIGIVVPILIIVGVIVAIIVCCISCLCCSCCPCYRRRHRGTVYGHVQSPSVVHVIQTPANSTPNYPSQEQSHNNYQAYPVNNTGMPQAPPPYTTENYSKQAPYNPNFTQGL